MQHAVKVYRRLVGKTHFHLIEMWRQEYALFVCYLSIPWLASARSTQLIERCHRYTVHECRLKHIFIFRYYWLVLVDCHCTANAVHGSMFGEKFQTFNWHSNRYCSNCNISGAVGFHSASNSPVSPPTQSLGVHTETERRHVSFWWWIRVMFICVSRTKWT